VSVAITGSTPNLTNNFSSLKAPRFPPSLTAYGYADVEVVNPTLGGSYFNVVTPCPKTFTQAGWQCGGGGGGGASFTPTGIQFATSTTAATVATGAQVAAALGATAVTNATNATSAATATALAATPGQCSAGLLATGIAANGNANCASPAGALFGTSIGDYLFKDASGTTITDSSGNGNAGTFVAGHEPVWVPNGLSFTSASPYQAVTLPAALNAAQTFEFVIYINPIPTVNGQFVANGFPALLTSSLGAAGVNIEYNGQFLGVYQLATFANSAGKTAGAQSFSGFHVLTVVLGVAGTSADHLYIDGVEGAYRSQGASMGFQTGGNYFLSGGPAPFTTSGILGTIYRFRAINGVLTPAQILSNALVLTSEVASRGVPTTPQKIISTSPQLFAVGDSITCALSGTCSTAFSWASQLVLTNQPAYTISNFGVASAPVQAMQGSEANRVAPRCLTTAGPSVAPVFAGTNDNVNVAATQTMQYLVSEIQTLKNAGCQVFVGTMISRTGTSNAPGTPTLDAQKNIYDALILEQAKKAGADGIIDFAANPLMGADGANTNANFQADHVHPTAAGQALLAVAASNSLNYYYGFTVANPNVITATTYQMLSGDGAITAAPTAASAYTMPDCTGPSGETYTISNPQAAFPVTIVGGTNQPINGLTSVITIPNNSVVTFLDVANPKTVSGCHWTMK